MPRRRAGGAQQMGFCCLSRKDSGTAEQDPKGAAESAEGRALARGTSVNSSGGSPPPAPMNP